MANEVNIVLRDLDTGAGRTGLTVTMRHVTDSYASTVYTMSEVGGKPGVYTKSDVAYNKYKFWVNGTEDDTIAAQWLPSDEGRLQKITDESGTYWECEGLEFRSAGETTEDNSLIRKSEADDRYLLAGTDDLDLSGRIVYIQNAVDLASPVTLEQLESVVMDPFQESPNVIRLIPGGAAKTAQVYITYASAVQYAKSVRASSRKMCIKVEGMGTSNTFIQISDGGISGQGYFENYISMVGLHEEITLKLPDDTLSFGTAGTATIENFTFIDTDGESNNTFTNVTFKNCKFNLAGEVTFSGCTFSGVNKIKSTGNQTFTSCKGGTVYSSEAIPSTVQGVGEIPAADLF